MEVDLYETEVSESAGTGDFSSRSQPCPSSVRWRSDRMGYTSTQHALCQPLYDALFDSRILSRADMHCLHDPSNGKDADEVVISHLR